jgi:hypothetical protein
MPDKDEQKQVEEASYPKFHGFSRTMRGDGSPPTVSLAFNRGLKSGKLDFAAVTDRQLLQLIDEVSGYLAYKARKGTLDA